MHKRRTRFGLLGIVGLVACLAQSASAALGVYQGAGCDGVRHLREFVRWFGRSPDQVLEFISWDMLEGRGAWAVRCWSRAGEKSVVFSLPMLPGDRSATLADGAAGKFDELFRDYATILLDHGYRDSVIRIGWEFNGDWYPWAASKDAPSWIAYWRRIVSAMRSVPGTAFRFDWCPAASWTRLRAEDAYPGDEFVDIVGLDFYNVTWDPTIVTAQQLWDSLLNGPHGLKWHREFAAVHGKPLSFPEWGTGKRQDGRGGGDDPYFIEQMAAWIRGNDVVYHNYWDYAHPAFNAKLSDGHQPRAGAAFISAFGPK